MNIVILALAGGHESHDENLQAQQETWFKKLHPNVRVIWCFGNSSKDYELDGNYLKVPCEEKFENLLYKTILATKWILKNLEFDYLIRSNTSSYFQTEHLYNYVCKLPKTNLFGGIKFIHNNFGTLKNPITFINGAGMYFSKDIVEVLSGMNIEEFKGLPDDVAISVFLKEKGFDICKVKINNLGMTHIFIPVPQIRVKAWRKPWATKVRMWKVHRFFEEKRKIYKIWRYFDLMLLELRILEPPYELLLRVYVGIRNRIFWTLNG